MISIVSAYHNRKEVLLKTLKTMEQSVYKDFEYIIVDDASEPSQRIEDFADEFSFVKLVRIEPEDKHHINPCIPFNMGFSLIKGDIVIIQAPECLHVGDVLSFVNNNSKDNQYLVFCCYSLSESASNKLDIDNIDVELQPRSTTDVGKDNSWFVHPVYRPAHYNFLTSMPTKDLMDLGGFDERFANGYDDTEFAARVSKKNMVISFIESPFCIHQFHKHNAIPSKEATNRRLYDECVKSSNYKVKNSFIGE